MNRKSQTISTRYAHPDRMIWKLHWHDMVFVCDSIEVRVLVVKIGNHTWKMCNVNSCWCVHELRTLRPKPPKKKSLAIVLNIKRWFFFWIFFALLCFCRICSIFSSVYRTVCYLSTYDDDMVQILWKIVHTN